MKDAPAALISLINGSNEFSIVDLYEITLANTDVLRYCSASHPITYPATGTIIPGAPVTFYPTLGIERGPVEWTCKPEVQSLDVTFLVNPDITNNGLPIAQAAMEGVFDGAQFVVYRGYISAGVLVDVLIHFSGTIADVKPSTTSIAVSVKSDLDKLNQKLPRNLYQPGCDHAFLDGGCDPGGTVRTANTSTGALIGTPTRFVLTISGTHAADFYQLGAILMTSGALVGQRRGIRSSVNGGGGHQLTLAVPFPRAPAAADTYSLIVGCDRKFTTCGTKFSNTSHFRGFPFVPRPEEQWR